MASYLDVAQDFLWTGKSRDALGCLMEQLVEGSFWSDNETSECLEDIDFHIQTLLFSNEEPIVLVAATESDQGDLSFYVRVEPLSGILERVELGIWKTLPDALPSCPGQLH